jgi:peptidoglycan/LPS O-acetylase OafA/YrhL
MVGLSALNYSSVGFLPNQFVYFALGIASFYVYSASGWFARTNPRTHDLLLPAIGVILFFLLRQPLPVLVWLVVMDVILARRTGLKTPLTSTLNGALELPTLQWLGRISYSVYLVHIPIMYVVFRAITRLNEHLGGWKSLILALPATIVLTLTVATFAYRWIEVPGMTLGRRLSERLTSKAVAELHAMRRKIADEYFLGRILTKCAAAF